MTQETFEKIFRHVVGNSWDLLVRKGRDYAAEKDRLENFRLVARVLDIDPVTVWGVYTAKHAISVLQFAGGRQLSTEGVDQRILDLLNYLILGYALLVDAGELPDPTSETKGSEVKLEDPEPGFKLFEKLVDGLRNRVREAQKEVA